MRGNFGLKLQNSPKLLDYIVMQMRKTNREKGYSHEKTYLPFNSVSPLLVFLKYVLSQHFCKTMNNGVVLILRPDLRQSEWPDIFLHGMIPFFHLLLGRRSTVSLHCFGIMRSHSSRGKEL